MKFLVTRTSLHEVNQKSPPCDGAKWMPFTRVDIRTVDDPTKILAYKDQDPAWWYQEGSNHRVVDGKIMRDFPAKGWFIKINSLKELIEFQAKYGELVLGPSPQNPDILRIEIYDSYRE